MSEFVVETHGLRKTFESEGAPVRALRGVDFSMTPAEFVAVMGPSGCGKSTLLNIVAGLDTPTDGEVSLAGEPLVGKTEDELAILRRRHIGIVFQFFNLLDDLTVLDNVLLPAQLAGASRRQASTRAGELLDRMGLREHREHYPARLSGGQRQAVAIARTRLSEPRIVLMDEPTAAISVRQVAEVLGLIRRLRERQIAVVLISHRMPDVFAVADRIVVLRRGRKVADKAIHQSSPEEVTGLITGAIEVA